MRRLALLACLLLLAGCQTGSGPMTPTATTPDKAPPVSVANGSDDPFDLPMFRSVPRANGTVEVVTVGNQHDFEGSVDLVVWNDAPLSRPIRVELTYLATNETLYRRVGIPANEAVEFDLLHSGLYRLSVTTNATTQSLSLGWDTFDCNDHTFGTRVGPGGNVSTVEIATEIACGPPGE